MRGSEATEVEPCAVRMFEELKCIQARPSKVQSDVKITIGSVGSSLPEPPIESDIGKVSLRLNTVINKPSIDESEGIVAAVRPRS